MPRGVYDRTLSKEERSAMKKNGGPAKKVAKAGKSADAPKRKYTKKSGKLLVDSNKDFNLTEYHPTKAAGTEYHASMFKDDQYFAMQEVRANISVLTMVVDKFSDLPSLKEEVEAHIALLGTLREKAFAEPNRAKDTHDEPAQDDETETGEDPNTVAQSAPYQGSVPLPPPIVPVPAPVAH